MCPFSPCSLASSVTSHANHPLCGPWRRYLAPSIPVPPVSSTSSCLYSILLVTSPLSPLAPSLFPSPPSSSAPSLCLHQPYFLQMDRLAPAIPGATTLPPVTPSDLLLPLQSLSLLALSVTPLTFSSIAVSVTPVISTLAAHCSVPISPSAWSIPLPLVPHRHSFHHSVRWFHHFCSRATVWELLSHAHNPLPHCSGWLRISHRGQGQGAAPQAGPAGLIVPSCPAPRPFG